VSTVVALGDSHELEGFALVGAVVIRAAGDAAISAAWNGLDTDVGLVILSPDAAKILGSRLGERTDVLTVTMP
jgi:vacuolar-type H+-ATPase subunit F/Vma7